MVTTTIHPSQEFVTSDDKVCSPAYTPAPRPLAQTSLLDTHSFLELSLLFGSWVFLF